MQKELTNAIRATLSYSDIFDYPLTSEEIWRFLISEKRFSQKEVQDALDTKNIILNKDTFYYLPKRTHILNKRAKNDIYSDKKYNIAHKISSYMGKFPAVLFVGLTGSVAMHNAQQNDDIDLFIITKKNTLWLSRFCMVILLAYLGVRRKKNETQPKDKICINLYMDEEQLVFPKNKQNLYTAHEVVQIKPLFSKNNTYERFILENKWVEKFLPNSLEKKLDMKKVRYEDSKEKNNFINFLISHFLIFFILFLESFAKRLQLWYMKEDGIKENVSDHMIAFYPHVYSEKILTLYKKRIKQYE